MENKPGGNGFIAMTAGAKAAPDGYTLVMVTVGDVAINPAMYKEMPYDVERDLAPIAMVSDAPMVLAANADAPFKSVADAIAAAKAQPGRISVATPGNGSVNQIVLEWMALNAGTQFQHIPYRAARRPPRRWRRATFRSACWRAPRSPRTSRADGSACSRSRWPSARRSIRIGRRCSRKA